MKREGAIEPTGVIVPSDDAIAFEDAMVVTPADATLVRDLNLSVPAGTNLLVTGPNGSGKSSLFRVLGGLWPLTKGRIHKPGGTEGDGLSHDIFYVPQRPYVTLGTLEEQLIYPLTASGDPRCITLTCSAPCHTFSAHLWMLEVGLLCGIQMECEAYLPGSGVTASNQSHTLHDICKGKQRSSSKHYYLASICGCFYGNSIQQN